MIVLLPASELPESLSALLAEWKAEVVRWLYGDTGVVIRLPEGLDPLEALFTLRALPGVLDAEFNRVYQALDQPMVIPNDPLFSRQWHLTAIRMPEAWMLERGRFDVIVAVIDSGYSPHGDLPQPGAPRFAGGVSFIGGEFWDETVGTRWSHGVEVAGIIGAISNNQAFGAGIAWHVRLMPIRVLNAAGQARIADVANAIRWATDHGAHVINLSLGDETGNPDVSATLESAIEYAVERGVTIVAAAGNHGGTVTSPASHPLVIAVGAVDRTGQPASWSARGDAASGLELDLVAPGEAIATTLSRGNQHTFSGETVTAPYVSGTSFAAPQVSAVVALLYSQGVLSRSMGPNAAALAREILRTTAVPLDPTRRYDDDWGYGLLNAYAALSWADLPGLDEVVVFAGTLEGDRLMLLTPPVRAAEDGTFFLPQVPAGVRTLYAWLDRDGSQSVSPGDYFAELPGVIIEANGVTTDVLLRLSLTDESYTLQLGP